MLLYSTLLCKKIARVPAGHKRFMPTKLGGGGRIDPTFDTFPGATNNFEDVH